MVQITNKILKLFLVTIFIFSILVFLIPILFGLIGTILPSLGHYFELSSNITFDFYEKVFFISGINKSIFLSIFVGILSTIISLILSQAILSKIYFTKHISSLKRLLFPLIAFPHITMAIGISFLFSSSGFLMRLISLIYNFERPPNTDFFPDNYGFFLILGLILKETPFFLLISLGVLSTIKTKEYFYIGMSQNYTNFTSWIIYVFPQIYKKMKISIFVVLIFSSSVIDLPLVLAPTTPSTLSIRILQQFTQPDLSNYSLAASLSILQFLLILTSIIIWLLIEKIIQNPKTSIFFKNILPKSNKILENTLLIISYALLFLFMINIFITILWAFADLWGFPKIIPEKISLNNFNIFFSYNFNTFFNTIFLAFLGSIISLIFVIVWLEVTDYLNYQGKFLNLIFYIPLLLPELSILLGISFFLIKSNFNNLYLNLIWINVIYILPYTFLIFSNSYKNINKNFIKIALSLGHNYLSIIFKVKLSLILDLLFLTLAIGFIISISLYAPIYLIGNGEISTLSLEIINFQTSGNRKDLAVATILQMFIPLIVLAVFHVKSKIYVKWKH